MGADREYDIVLLGATGFTGGLTADYLATAAPPGLRWAVAGRDPAALAALRERWSGETTPETVVADVTDAASLTSLAARSRVVASTVGPYLRYGAPLVAACAAAGTDYLDLTGEPEFVDRMWLDHHDTAVASGARLVHACGFDSIPHDLGALFTVRRLPPDAPITLRGVVRASGGASGGTLHSALTAMSRPSEARAAARDRRTREVRDSARSSRAVGGRPHRDPDLGYWLLPLPTIDPIIVARSGAAVAEYGPRFRYSHYAGTKTLPYAVAGATGVTALVALAQLPPARRLLLSRSPAGTGPSDARRSRSWFTVDFVGEAAGHTVHTRVSGGDPGYAETATMLAESALCLALDDLPDTRGQVTTAYAMGDALLARLQAAGIRFEEIARA